MEITEWKWKSCSTKMTKKSRMRAINVETHIFFLIFWSMETATSPRTVCRPRALSNPSLEGCIRRMILGTRFRGGLVDHVLNTPLTHQGGLADRRRPRGRHTARPPLLHGHGLYWRPLCLGLAFVPKIAKYGSKALRRHVMMHPTRWFQCVAR